MIVLKINVTRIDKDHLFDGKNGKYLDLALMENKDGPDQYGNNGFVTQGISKEKRDAGERGPIVGNWKHVGQTKAPAPQKPNPAADPLNEAPIDNDDIPF